MIRSLWTILVTLAIANTLGFIIFLAWLSATDRLSPQRVHALQELFGETVTAQKVADDRAQKQSQAQAEKDALEAAIGTPPVTAEGRSQYIEEISRRAEQGAIRAKREASDRQETLFKWQRDLESREESLRTEKEAFERMRQEIAEREGSEQFKKTLKVYENLPPEETAAIFISLARDGFGDEEQVVSFLNAMKPRIASDVMSSILAEEPAMAADLLERLREYGVNDGAAPEEPG